MFDTIYCVFGLGTARTIGIYCSAHSKENMIDIITKRCLEDNCGYKK